MQISKVYQTRVFAPKKQCTDQRRLSFAKDRHSLYDFEPRRIRMASSKGTTIDVTPDRFSLTPDVCSTIGNTPMVNYDPTDFFKNALQVFLNRIGKGKFAKIAAKLETMEPCRRLF